MRATFDTKTIIAGNVVTGEMVEELLLAGADIIKVVKPRRSTLPNVCLTNAPFHSYMKHR